MKNQLIPSYFSSFIHVQTDSKFWLFNTCVWVGLMGTQLKIQNLYTEIKPAIKFVKFSPIIFFYYQCITHKNLL